MIWHRFWLAVPEWFVEPFWHLIVLLFGMELLLPRAWILIEQGWWRLMLKHSPVGRLLRRIAMEDFNKAIEQRVIDGALPRPLAVLLAIAARPFELPSLTVELRRRKSEMIADTYESAINQLNKGWREGTPPQILNHYVRDIEDCVADPTIDREAALRGKCATSVVKYALGDITGGNNLGRANWLEAQRLETDKQSTLKFLASYGYFNSTLFLGNAHEAMVLMANQWSLYYAPLNDPEKARLREQLSGKLILNPILALPRHLILAAAFNETPIFEKTYWPSEAGYLKLNEAERTCKIRWVEEWYSEAKSICTSEPTSLNFSHAYAGFYLTLLLLEAGMPAAYLHNRINEAFDAIHDDSAAIVAQYVKHGFGGVYHLLNGENEKALDKLSRAASFSAISGNRFADVIFSCCHAVAAARLTRPSRYLDPEITYYMNEAERLARTIGRDFYRRLCNAAHAAVYRERGEKAKAERFLARSRQGAGGDRILRIFERDALELQPNMVRRQALDSVSSGALVGRHTTV
ncbi:MAG TPA: hypothetical protein VGN90_09860 [Pyrinomonadaceae bacterium]|jgi:hypothetical protein|nr:hypothetical protein [Pyrinomonadaceae bacterium]